MEYLTYPQYQAMGGRLSMSEFTPLEYACRKRIDLLTDCRVQPMADAGAVPEAVRMCMFALINLESKVGVTAQVAWINVQKRACTKWKSPAWGIRHF